MPAGQRKKEPPFGRRRCSNGLRESANLRLLVMSGPSLVIFNSVSIGPGGALASVIRFRIFAKKTTSV
jgi:hypothetical protein